MPVMFGIAYSNIIITCSAILLAGAIAIFCWKQKHVTGAVQLLILSLLGLTWGLLYLCEILGRTIEFKVFWDNLQYLPISFLPPAFFAFSMIFTDKQRILQKPAWLLLYIMPLVNLIIIWTNNTHHWFRTAAILDPIQTGLVTPLINEYGFWFWIIIGYSLLLLLLSIIILIIAYYRTPKTSRWHIGSVIIGAFIPFLAGIASIPVWLNQIPANITLFAITISLSLVAWSLFNNRILNVMPLAHDFLLNQMSDAVVTLDANGMLVACNPAAEAIPLLNLKDRLGEHFPDLLKPWLDCDLPKDKYLEKSCEITVSNGSLPRIYDMLLSPLLNNQQKCTGYLVVFREMTGIKQQDMVRRQIEERYQAIFENATNGILLLDAQGSILEANDESCALSGYQKDQLISSSLWDLIPEAPHFQVKRAPEKYSIIETELVHAGGENIPVEMNITPIIGDENLFYITIQDIRQRRRTEQTSKSALENLQSRMDELALIRQVTESLNHASTLRGALLPVLETATAITKSQSIWVLLGEKDQTTFQKIIYSPLDDTNPLSIETTQEKPPKCLQKLFSGETEHPREYKSCDCLSSSDFRPHLTLPLYLGKRPLGIMNIAVETGFLTNENKVRLLHTLCDSLSVVIERVRLFKSEYDQRKLAETLQDVGTTLTASLDLNEVLDLLLDQLSRLIPYDGGNVMLVEGSAARISRIRGYTSLSRKKFTSLSKLSFDIKKTFTINEMLTNGKPIIIEDTAKMSKWVETEISPEFHSWLGAPVFIEGKMAAVFALDVREPGFFTPEHAELLSSFVNQASLAIKNARLYTNEANRIKELDGLRETLTNITSELDVRVLLLEIVRKAIQLLDATQGEIGLYEPENKSLRILVSENLDKSYVGSLINIGDGVMGTVAKTMKPLAINNYQEWPGRLEQYEKLGPQSGLAVPLLTGSGELLGVIGVGDKETGRVFTDDNIRLLNLFGQQATIALRNAQLFEDAKKRAEEAETIRKASAVIVSTLNQDEAIHLILEQLAQVVPYDSASVLMLQKGVLKIVGGHGFRDENPVMGLEVPLDKTNPGACVFMENKPIFVGNIPVEYPHFNQFSKDNNIIRSWLGVPLTIQDRPIGILSLDAHNLNHFNEEHARLVSTFADQVAISLDNASLYENALRSAHQFETLYNVSQIISANIRSEEIYPAIHQATTELMETEFFSISLINQHEQTIEDVYMMDRDEKQELTKRPVTTGVFGKVIQDGKSRLYNTFGSEMVAETGAVLIGDDQEDEVSQSLLIVPFKIGGKTTGILSAQSYKPYAYTDTDLEILELLAANVAIAIENARLFGEVQELAITDSLTHLSNRRKFMEIAQQEFARAQRYKDRLAVIMLDIDHFKQVNDTYGHNIGDQVLQQLAAICKTRLREVDTICRYGGEEFAILLPETNGESAFTLAERLRVDTAKTPMLTSAITIKITISLGVVCLDSSCKTLEELIDRSDQAMYASKRAGRNKVTLWTSEIKRENMTGGEQPPLR